MVEVALEELALLLFVWFLQSEQKSMRIVKTYCRQLMLQILQLLHLLLHLRM